MKIFTVSITLLLVIGNVLFAQKKDVLQLHPQNPHYFLYKNKPTVLIGSGEHYGSVINLDFNYTKYLETLSQEELNLTRLFTGAYIEKQGDFGIQKNTLAPAEGRLVLPWQRSESAGFVLGGNKFDLTKWDDSYFQRLKDFMSLADRNGVIVEVNLFSSYYQNGWNYSVFNTKNNINQTDSIAPALANTLNNGNILNYQQRYVRKIVKELNRFNNFYFEIQNEPWASQTDTVLVRDEYADTADWRSTIQVVSKKSNDWQRQVAQWIKEEENQLPNKHLISQNISNFHYPITNPDPNISIFNFHYTVPQAVAENFYVNKVIGFNETGFAGRENKTYRRQAWRFIMAGGGLFNQLDYSFSVGFENGQDATYTAPGGGNQAFRKQLSNLKQFFERLNYIQLKPDNSFITAASGAMTETLSNGHSLWIVYYEPMATTPGKLIVNLPKGLYQAIWTDVVTGQLLQTTTVKDGQVDVSNGGNDKVLTIQTSATK
ncbi:hypothetical protein [Segetibacter koreensis]|uniref:hypothetical protein n=1 Tax=Segetibacter koreensis TaxID=398037 RepID=UPI0003741A7C|nr:hypothetical protein [Segetibacter koreensis]